MHRRDSWMVDTHWHRVKEEFMKFLGEHRGEFLNALEVGCGSHPFDKEMQEFNIAPICIDRDVHKLGYGDETFDLLMGCHCFEHFENPVQALRETMRVLKKGGVLWFATPFPCGSQMKERGHIFVLSTTQWAHLLEYVGFKDIKSSVQKTYMGSEMGDEHSWNVITWARK